MTPFLDALSKVAILSAVLPVAAAIRVRPLSLPLKLVVLYSAVALVEGLVMWYLSSLNQRNLWMVHLFTPFEVTVLLLAMSRWQARELARLTVVLCIPAFLLLWGILTIRTESLAEFPQYAKSAEAILLVAVAAGTLVSRTRSLVAPILSQPWFWVTTGILIYFPFLAILNPVANELLQQQAFGPMLWVFSVNAALIILHNILFAWAIRCQQQQVSFGGSSLPRQSLASS